MLKIIVEIQSVLKTVLATSVNTKWFQYCDQSRLFFFLKWRRGENNCILIGLNRKHLSLIFVRADKVTSKIPVGRHSPRRFQCKGDSENSDYFRRWPEEQPMSLLDVCNIVSVCRICKLPSSLRYSSNFCTFLRKDMILIPNFLVPLQLPTQISARKHWGRFRQFEFCLQPSCAARVVSSTTCSRGTELSHSM